MRPALPFATCVCAAFLSAAHAFADTAAKDTPAGTLAGRWIPSAAEVSYSMGNEQADAPTNNTLIQVAEIVKFDLNTLEEGKVGVKADEEYEFEFEITNTGNGTECFSTTPVDADQDALAIAPVKLHSDTDEDGSFSFTDQKHNFSECSIWLEPGQTKRLFITGRTPRGVEADRAYFSILVGPSQGLAEIGTVYAPNSGDFQSDALSGTDPEEGYATFYAQGSTLRVGLRKSAVIAGDASLTNAVPGETIAYTLRFTGEGEGSVLNAVVADPLPATLAYVPGSLKLDGVALTDAADSDAGSFDAGLVSVNVGSRIAPFDNFVTFEAVVLDPTQMSELN